MATDTKYLEQHRGKWRVSIGVPKHLQSRFGTRLKQSLHTDSLTIANRLKGRVIEQLRSRMGMANEDLAQADRNRRSAFEALRHKTLREAADLKKVVAKMTEAQYESARYALDDRVQDLLGSPIRVEYDEEGGPIEIFDPERERLAADFMDIAIGYNMPFTTFDSDFKQKKMDNIKARTIEDHDRALERLEAWCRKNDVKPDIKAITTIIAKRFSEGLADFDGGLAPRSVKKYVTRLKRYWDYMVYKEEIEINPWMVVVVDVPEEKDEDLERAFSEREAATLLMGPASVRLKDVMMIAALTGARLDVIVKLKAKDIVNSCFYFGPQKREKRGRYVPIHDDLYEIVERRLKGKNPEDDLFPDFPANSKDSSRERSFKASNQFTTYRRRVGVDEVLPGKRRALTNFHSWRRYFITKAERVSENTDLIAAIVGHKRSGITLGLYSEGPEINAARDIIAKIKLPPLDGSPIVEPEALAPRKPRID